MQNLWKYTLALKNKFISKSSQVPVGTQEARIRNDRQAVFQLVRDLVEAQFDQGYYELTKAFDTMSRTERLPWIVC